MGFFNEKENRKEIYLKQKIEGLERQHKNISAFYEHALAEAKRLQNELEFSNGTVGKYSDLIDDLRNEKDTLSKRNVWLEKNIVDYQNAIEKTNKINKDLQTENYSLRIDIDSHKEALKRRTAEKEELLAERRNLRDVVDRYSDTISELSTKVCELENKIIGYQEREVAVCRAPLDQIHTSWMKLKEDLSKAERMLDVDRFDFNAINVEYLRSMDNPELLEILNKIVYSAKYGGSSVEVPYLVRMDTLKSLESRGFTVEGLGRSDKVVKYKISW